MHSKIRRNIVSVLMAGAALSLGGNAFAQQVVSVDNDGPSGPNPLLFTTGLVTTGVSYAPALAVAINSDRSEDDYLYAPFVGPWLDLAARGGDGSGLQRTLLAVDGVFQTIGALEILASFMFVDGDGGNATAAPQTFQASVAPARMPGGGYGLVAAGTF